MDSIIVHPYHSQTYPRCLRMRCRPPCGHHWLADCAVSTPRLVCARFLFVYLLPKCWVWTHLQKLLDSTIFRPFLCALLRTVAFSFRYFYLWRTFFLLKDHGNFVFSRHFLEFPFQISSPIHFLSVPLLQDHSQDNFSWFFLESNPFCLIENFFRRPPWRCISI